MMSEINGIFLRFKLTHLNFTQKNIYLNSFSKKKLVLDQTLKRTVTLEFPNLGETFTSFYILN